MEGIGSRPGRTSSRYASVSGPSFKGPVRKWKRGWVCSQPNHIPFSAVRGRLRPRHHHLQRLPETEKPAIMLCRWTRLSDQPEPTTKRKFRYYPIVVLEEKKKKKEAAAEVNGMAKGKEVKEFKPMTREDMLMESDDENEFEEEPEDLDYFAKMNLNLR